MIIFIFDNDSETYKEITGAAVRTGVSHTIYRNENLRTVFKLGESDPCCIIFINTRLHGKKQNSFSIASSLREKLPESHIIFVSAYQEDMVYCLKNLIRPSAFLLKPLTNTEIDSVLSAVIRMSVLRSKSKSICISTHEFKRKIEVGKILYFATSGKKLLCRTITGEKIEFYGTITELADRFPEEFVRCHSSFLVNRIYIKSLNKLELELSGTTEKIPVSHKYKANLLDDLAEIAAMEIGQINEKSDK